MVNKEFHGAASGSSRSSSAHPRQIPHSHCNPVRRCGTVEFPIVRRKRNVCPEYGKPAQPSLYAFSYTVPAPNARRGSFIIAGGGEARGGAGTYRERIVRYGETSPEAMRDKLRHVVAEMERRLTALGFSWKDAVSTQAYSVQDIGALVGPEIAVRGAAAGGLSWHFARPPLIGLEYEMDVRAAAREIVV